MTIRNGTVQGFATGVALAHADRNRLQRIADRGHNRAARNGNPAQCASVKCSSGRRWRSG